jgi:tetraacyldisaccharide 4'-kinase
VNFFLRILLLPFTLIYITIVRLRNFCYDTGIFSSKSFRKPIICVGNLNVGGTGKTPHTEFILSHLKKNHQVASLSRGYGRATKGFRIADSSDNPETIGDEPFQIFSKFEDVIVAVDEKRKRGIKKLYELPASPEIIVLDDAFQHRKVKAGLNILLTDYSKLYIHDIPLPSGRLREPRSAAKRADIIIITKSPAVLSPLEIRRITSSLNPKPYQKVFYSFISYRKLKPLNETAADLDIKKRKLRNFGVLLVSAIANPNPLNLYLKRYAKEIDTLAFKDHHFFKAKDYQKVKKKLDELLSPKKIIVTTEKDASKLDVSKFGDIPVFCIPIEIKFHKHEDQDFIQELDQYVRSYTRE